MNSSERRATTKRTARKKPVPAQVREPAQVPARAIALSQLGLQTGDVLWRWSFTGTQRGWAPLTVQDVRPPEVTFTDGSSLCHEEWGQIVLVNVLSSDRDREAADPTRLAHRQGGCCWALVRTEG